ncbi:bestrophin family protein [Sphingobacterium sp. Mn56C]|uniref:bestrophin family protein n=1 Tax=Sphingobacterium sp. Mn56C TaxID=3395261 RepID=UPI003BD8DF1D
MLLKGKISVFDFVKTIKLDITAITAFSIIIGFISTRNYFSSLVIPLGLIAIIGTAISLLLAFRTGQSYDRWWEARTVWGAIVNDSRTLLRQLQEFLPDDYAADIRLFVERQIIWNYALSESLRGQGFSPRVQDFIAKHKVKGFNIPNGIISLHGKHLKKMRQAGAVSDYHMVQIDETLSRLCDSMGRCERIKSTVFPVSYGTLIHFLIYLFALLLPFGIDDEYPYIKTALTAGLPIIFIFIEQTAILMQDPFENGPMDTPMTTISTHIEIALLQQLGDEVEKPKPVDPDAYYIL